MGKAVLVFILSSVFLTVSILPATGNDTSSEIEELRNEVNRLRQMEEKLKTDMQRLLDRLDELEKKQAATETKALEAEQKVTEAMETKEMVVQKQLKDHLNINIELTILPFAQLIEKSFQGSFGLMRAGWVADYPSAENFLWIFYGKNLPNNTDRISYPNISRYSSSVFDSYFDRALNARNIEDANSLFKNAERKLMKDAPIVVLWYDEGYRLIQSYVKNFPNNPMQYRDFSEVYFKKPKQLN